jgi:hypothetical protein
MQLIHTSDRPTNQTTIDHDPQVAAIRAAHLRVRDRHPRRKLNAVRWQYFTECDNYPEQPGEKPQNFILLLPEERTAILCGNFIEAGRAIASVALRLRGNVPRGVPQTGWYAQSLSADGSRTWFYLGATPEAAAAVYDAI